MALEGAAGASAWHGHKHAFLISVPVPGVLVAASSLYSQLGPVPTATTTTVTTVTITTVTAATIITITATTAATAAIRATHCSHGNDLPVLDPSCDPPPDDAWH